MAYFPFFVELEHREGLIVGGGAVALRKLQKLLPYGPRLTVAAPEICPEIAALPGLTLIRRRFSPDMLDGAFFAVAATDDGPLNHEIYALCVQRRIPVNTVDDRDACSFLFPALVRRGPLSIGISTGGASPTAAAYLREQINALLPERLEECLSRLEALRGEVKARVPDETRRAACFQALFAACMQRDGPLEEAQLRQLLRDFTEEDAR